MSMAWIRRQYGVPAKQGGRVIYTGQDVEQFGTIRSARGAYLSVVLDGERIARTFHPTWELRYIDLNQNPSARSAIPETGLLSE